MRLIIDLQKETEAVLHRLFSITKKPMAFIDFEFNNSQEFHPNLVSFSVTTFDGITTERQDHWLHNDESAKLNLSNWIKYWVSLDYTFVAYAAAAEARCFWSLGIDPMSCNWLDLYAEWRQLTFNNNSCEYGTIFQHGYKKFSVAPSFIKEKNKGRCNEKVGLSMAASAAQMFGINIDTDHKDKMRDLILLNKDDYTPEERHSIMSYCASDIMYLPIMWDEMMTRLSEAIKKKPEVVFTIQLRRGKFISAVAKMESRGYPVEVDQIKAIRHNFDLAQDTILTDLCDNYYPFFDRVKKNKKDLHPVWLNKETNFEAFIESIGKTDSWPRTESGKLARDEKVLDSFRHIPEIEAYRNATKMIKQLAWFKTPDEEKKKKDGDFFESVGADHRLRTFLGAYGSQTARNQPKASRFILAMSSWLRCLVKPKQGKAIIGIDYSSQEFAIAAILSDDKMMMEAYRSGDPYCFFAIKAGAIPETANKKWIKNPPLVLKDSLPGMDHDWWSLDEDTEEWIIEKKPELWEEYQKYAGYASQRSLAKGTVLGLQFGMSYKKLAEKLTGDMKRTVTEDEALALVNMHKRLFKVMWSWQDKIERMYNRDKYLMLWGGWSILGDCDNSLSLRNAPVQGHGSVIMQEAVVLAEAKGIQILSPLHDAIYAEADEDKAEEQAAILADCMRQAVINVIGDKLEVRMDIDIHKSTDTWIEDKGRRWYEKLNKYLVFHESMGDREKSIVDKILSNMEYENY